MKKGKDAKTKNSFLTEKKVWYNTSMDDIGATLAQNLKNTLKNLTQQDIPVELEHPSSESFGDYSTSVAMRCFKLGSASGPWEFAQKIKEEYLKLKDPHFEKIEVLRPGFVNFFLSKEFLIRKLEQALEAGKQYGWIDETSKTKVMVEFTDPNPFKELHIGHLYSNIIGESLSRIFEANGAEVFRADYFGDVGMHVAKSLWGMLHQNVILSESEGSSGSVQKDSSPAKRGQNDMIVSLEKKPLEERVKFLGQAYADGSNAFAQSKEVQEKVRRLNKLIYIAAQKMWQNEKNLTPQIDYLKGEKIDEKELEEVYLLYTTGRKWSLEYFETLYKRLGTKFDGYYPESIAGERGYKLVKENIQNGIFVESDGAVIFPGEKYGLHNRVFINSLGLPTYEAKELGLAPWKHDDFVYDLSLIVTGAEIADYFSVLITALKKVEPELGKKTKPVLHGMVKLPEGKMSSRSGNVITVNSLLDEIKNRIIALYSDIDSNTAEMVAVGAVKYALLKSHIGKDIVFNMEESININGNSGPYLQYAFARTRSILAKRKAQSSKLKTTVQNLKLEPEEIALLRSLRRFPEAVKESAENYSPNSLCLYLFDLAQKFNLFYQRHQILSAKDDNAVHFRLALTSAVGIVLKNGLWMLGIEAPERL